MIHMLKSGTWLAARRMPKPEWFCGTWKYACCVFSFSPLLGLPRVRGKKFYVWWWEKQEPTNVTCTVPVIVSLSWNTHTLYVCMRLKWTMCERWETVVFAFLISLPTRSLNLGKMTTVPGPTSSVSSPSSAGVSGPSAVVSKSCYTIDGILFKSSSDNPADQLFDLSQITNTHYLSRPVVVSSPSEDLSLTSGSTTTGGEGTTPTSSHVNHNNSTNVVASSIGTGKRNSI